MRRGVHAGNSALVAHAVTGEAFPKECLVGFVVPKKVFMRANQRNLAKRRLRHLMRERLCNLPDNTILIIRILPGFAQLSFAEITTFLDSAFQRILEKLETSISTSALEAKDANG